MVAWWLLVAWMGQWPLVCPIFHRRSPDRPNSTAGYANATQKCNSLRKYE